MTAAEDTLIRGFILEAEKAAAAGQRDEVQRLLARAEAAAPAHPLVLNARAVLALQAGNSAAARELLDRAVLQDSANPALWLNLAAALRALSLADEEDKALDAALKLSPRNFVALLQKAELLELRGKPKSAAKVYQNALQTLPVNARLPNSLRAQVERAFAAVKRNDDALEARIEEALRETRANFPAQETKRADHGIAAFLGRRRIYHPQPTFLHVPSLPSDEFYERAQFPWLAEFEAATAEIRAECLRVLAEDSGEVVPYIQRPDGVPLDQWTELNQSRRWSAFFLWRDGERVPANAARCPRTAALLEAAPLANVPGYAPSAFFSILDKKSHIPAHTGVTNSRLIVHLPLVVPAGCRFRVGSETREWREGEAWVFDDTLEHEAWNDSEQPRAILIFDVWHPALSQGERELIRRSVPAIKDYYRDEVVISGAQ